MEIGWSTGSRSDRRDQLLLHWEYRIPGRQIWISTRALGLSAARPQERLRSGIVQLAGETQPLKEEMQPCLEKMSNVNRGWRRCEKTSPTREQPGGNTCKDGVFTMKMEYSSLMTWCPQQKCESYEGHPKGAPRE